jgi:pantetheine-phosphate adenylyltransferase
MIPNSKFHVVALAGTFDLLHKGHKVFLTRAFEEGQKVIIGLMTDGFVKKKQDTRNKIQDARFKIYESGMVTHSYNQRKIELEKFLKDEKVRERATIIPLGDVYGPGAEKNEIEALIVSPETKKGGELVNKKRAQLGLAPLALVEVPHVLSSDGKIISSTRIRQGEIDREGRIYISEFRNQNSEISTKLRNELKKPLGTLVPGDRLNLEKIIPAFKKHLTFKGPTFQGVVVTVGDEVTRLMQLAWAQKLGLVPRLCVFDFKVNRIEKYKKIQDLGFMIQEYHIVETENPPGCITSDLVIAVENAFKKIHDSGFMIHDSIVIKINGEDDLAGVPAILLAPLGTIVLYGQPGQGIVVVEVTEKKKEELVALIHDL